MQLDLFEKPKGIRAEYIDHMGDDLRVVNAARVSFDKQSSWDGSFEVREDDEGDVYCVSERFLSEKDAKLIHYLASHGHWTPFSHPQITLRETIPIFVARQRFKHMIGFTYNEVSRRYVDDAPEFYEPDEWRGRAENKKQGSSDKVISFDLKTTGICNSLREAQTVSDVYERCLALYQGMLENGIAPEQARMVLPQSMMTSYYVTGSLAAFARAYKLRIDSHAQKEIQDLAKEWDRIIRPLFPVSWEALTQTEG